MALTDPASDSSTLSDEWLVPSEALASSFPSGLQGGFATSALDPYWWWFVMSGPESMLDSRNWPERIYFAAEREPGADFRALEERVLLQFHLSIPVAYKDLRYLTLSMDVKGWREALYEAWTPLAGLSDEENLFEFDLHCAELILNLQVAKCFRRMAMGVPIRARDWEGQASQDTLVQNADSNPPSAKSSEVVLGLVDDGLPYLHAALRDQNASRLVGVWDQRWSRPHAHPAAFNGDSGFGYGAVSNPTVISQAISDVLQNNATEHHLYAAHGFADMRSRNSHGAGVLHLLAGNTSACGPSLPPAWAPKEACSHPVIGVQIPFRHSSRRSLAGWLAVHVIDGLYFIAAKAKARDPKHLLVNLSLGAYGGPHDGSAIVDGAMDEWGLSQPHVNAKVVAATGNTAGMRRDPTQPLKTRRPSGIHASGRCAKDRPLSFTLRVPPDKGEDTFLEIWFDRELESLAPIHIALEGPTGSKLERNSFGHMLDFKQLGTAPQGIFFFRRVSQSRAEAADGSVRWRSMALIALAPTRTMPENPRRRVPPGDWTVTLTWQSLRESEDLAEAEAVDCEVDAWVERDDTWAGSRRGQQARLIAAHGQAAQVTDKNTFTSLAHSNSGVTAGAMDGTTRQASPYSAEHQAGKVTDYSSVADRSPTRRGILVAGTHSGSMRLASGTSLAAPQVTRALADSKVTKPGSPCDEKKGAELP